MVQGRDKWRAKRKETFHIARRGRGGWRNGDLSERDSFFLSPMPSRYFNLPSPLHLFCLQIFIYLYNTTKITLVLYTIYLKYLLPYILHLSLKSRFLVYSYTKVKPNLVKGDSEVIFVIYVQIGPQNGVCC